MKITVKQLKQLIKEQLEEQDAQKTTIRMSLKSLINDMGGGPEAVQAIRNELEELAPTIK